MSTENTLPAAATTVAPSTPAPTTSAPSAAPAANTVVPQAKPAFAGKPAKQRKQKLSAAPTTTNPTAVHS